MRDSKINWTHHTANFWWGCQKVSPGCKNCYAETLSNRWGKLIWGPPATTQREYKEAIWKDILKWDKKARQAREVQRVFVSSMSDFLEDHPMVSEWRERAIKVIEELKWLDILILTKRPENFNKLLPTWKNGCPDHVWFGTSIENQEMAEKRIWQLSDIPAKIKFLSVEPLLESLDIGNWKGINWVIVGGESGPKCRPFEWDWARSIRDYCVENGIAFWMKQGGGHPNKRENLEDLPEDLRIRELPTGVAGYEQELLPN